MRLIAAMTLGLLVTLGCATRAEVARVSQRANRTEALMVHWHERATEREGQLKQLQSKLNRAEQRLARAQAACQAGSSHGAPKPPASKSGGIDDKTIERCEAVVGRLTQDGGSLRDWWRACRSSGAGR